MEQVKGIPKESNIHANMAIFLIAHGHKSLGDFCIAMRKPFILKNKKQLSRRRLPPARFPKAVCPHAFHNIIYIYTFPAQNARDHPGDLNGKKLLSPLADYPKSPARHLSQ